MMLDKKGIELTMQTVVIFIILVIVLLVMIFFFANNYVPNSEGLVEIGNSTFDELGSQ